MKFRINYRGQSLIEVIVALAIFIIIAGTSIVAILSAFSTTRLSEEENTAAMYASEGLEAAASIRNFDWRSLSDGTYGLLNSGGVWEFSGASDAKAKFTREVTLASVERDTVGEVVTSGGMPDPDTKRITVKVSWKYSPLRNNVVEMESLLTNWGEVVKVGIETPALTPTVTQTPTPTPTLTITPTPTSTISTCASFCQNGGYINGACRKKPADCSVYGEVYQSGGDLYCTVNPNIRCCCLP